MSSKEIDPTAAVVGEWPTSLTSRGTATADYKDSSTLPKLQLFFLHLYLALLLSLSMPLFFSLILPLLLSVLPLQRKVEENCSNPCDGTSASSSGVTPATKNPVPETLDQTDPPAPTSLTSPVKENCSNPCDGTSASSSGVTPATKNPVPETPDQTGDILSKAKAFGEEIVREHSRSSAPLMLPPAPKHPFIDVLSEADLKQKKKMTEAEQQEQQEAEVIVYRALERLNDQRLKVLAGFQYTHDQYQAIVGMHECKLKQGHDTEGECDFVVVLENILVILEVKAPTLTSNAKSDDNKFKKNLSESIKQRIRTRKLLEGICKTSEDFNFVILEFTVFTNIVKQNGEQFNSYQRNTDAEKQTIVFNDDITNFTAWWEQNVRSHFHHTGRFTPVSTLHSILIGLWCMDKANTCHTDKCSLTYCMDQIDDQLKRSVITRTPKAPVSSSVKGGPALFKKHLNIECITTDQKNIFVEKQNCLLISGPAGTGKTVMILGKILDLVLKKITQHKIVLVVFGTTNHTHCEQVLRSALRDKVSSRKVKASSYDEEVIQQEARDIERELETSTWRVNILQVDASSYYTTRLLAALLPVLADKHYHIFVDDCQDCGGYNTGSYYHAIPRVLAAPQPDGEPCTRWVACDLVQERWGLEQTGFYVLNNIPAQNVKTLSGVLRNTFEICRVLAVIRNHYISKCRTQFTISDTFLPAQQPGHYIHGPLPRLCVIQYQREEDVERGITPIVKEELEKLRSGNDLVDHNKIAIVASRWLSEVRLAVEADDITVLGTDYIASAEWQAVIGVVHCSTSRWRLAEWYRAVSRAKVYCSLIVAVTAEKYRIMEDVFNKLEPFVNMRHVTM